ncbi:restriction endonuclease subunit S [Treponema denticola]|uniref:restriction endonuclease subunit S n=1 Tax=Treponema denticola TaxID=158 RepID=UPI0020A59174|nr:restriction endonuclease subunit S [Treponema denticola]UTD13252.1 restriction endonuclease subunit S [Treponema denticola]
MKDIEDEIPFAVPEGWAWCRLGELSKLISKGTTPRGGKNAYTVIGVNYLRIENINDYGTIDLKNISHITEEEHFGYLKRSILQENDFIVSIAGTLGKTAIVRKQDLPLNTNQAVAFVRLEHFDILNLQFLRIIIESSTIKELLLKQTKVTSIPNLTLEIISSCFIPLPPLAEQKRIVTAIEAILAQIDLLEQNKADLQTAVKQAKSKILDLAIRGKLVPQDPVDEPASVMLEKLRAEKEVKIAAGEIKRGKNESYIYKNSTDNCYYEKFFEKKDLCIDNEIPFELPANWQWCRLGEVCDYGKCENIEVSELKPDDWILDLEDIEKDSGKIITFHSFAERRSESTKHIFRKGDLLYSKLRPYLNKVVIAPKDGFCTSEILPLNFNGVLLNEFAQRLLMSFFFLSTVNMLVYGVKMPRLGRDDAKKIFIPIPPISEQKRIVAKIEEIFNALDDTQSNLV